MADSLKACLLCYADSTCSFYSYNRVKNPAKHPEQANVRAGFKMVPKVWISTGILPALCSVLPLSRCH